MIGSYVQKSESDEHSHAGEPPAISNQDGSNKFVSKQKSGLTPGVPEFCVRSKLEKVWELASNLNIYKKGNF